MSLSGSISFLGIAEALPAFKKIYLEIVDRVVDDLEAQEAVLGEARERGGWYKVRNDW